MLDKDTKNVGTCKGKKKPTLNNLTAQQHNGPLLLHDKTCGFPPLSSAFT